MEDTDEKIPDTLRITYEDAARAALNGIVEGLLLKERMFYARLDGIDATFAIARVSPLPSVRTSGTA
jgi:hypothetical protein